MARHVSRRPPRAHWLLLLFGSLILLAELCLHGYVSHAGGEGTAATPHRPALPAVEPLTGTGPVLRIAADGTVQRAQLPAGAVALTFDDGPDPRWTPQILDVLRQHRAHATFFVIGSKVNQYPDLVRRIVAEGHELGVHTYTHTELAAVPAWRQRLELSLTQNAIAAATGRTTQLMRPPYSSTADAVTAADLAALRTAGAAGYLAVLTDQDTDDWRRPGVDAIVAAAKPKDGTGAVVMLHDGGGDRSQTLEATRRILTGAPGVRFVTVSEGLGLPAPPAATFDVTARGVALRWTQSVAAWLSTLLLWLLMLGTGLAVLRLVLQVLAAGVHGRRARRLRGRARYLGPVSVIVPAFNEAANIAATVRSLLANDYPGLEVIVVDDGSTDATAAIVEGLRLPGVRLIRQRNAGKPAALNTGVAAARSALLILVDGDTVFEPDAVGQLVQPFTDPGVGAVSGNTKVANRRGLLGRWQHLEYVVGFNLDRRMFDLGECMPTIPGAIGAFRRQALIDVGGVPPDTLAEDTDLTMAVLRAGWRAVYADRAIAWTEAPATLRQLWRQRYRWCYGTLQAMWKHRRALTERGSAGRFGRRGLIYLLLFQVLLPLTAPLVDVYSIYGLFFLPAAKIAAVWCGFTGLQVLTTAYALRLDRESYAPLWTVPLQQIVYRQLLYLVVVQSAVAALLGGRQRWQAMARTGLATTAVPGQPSQRRDAPSLQSRR
ncbi:bifunctional polysaccharide deacetylase/glycosyltransferase family 2 protein [Dactylosporangium sp. NPDC049525]|uniref:bifunctional polysaccharide deacetylase/glycosyltransferase family 2 protein n=1 Tax=Dactylosporangium sp. NPDC049525 TaxID=3154730 RepID=UPI00342A85E2